MRKLFLLTVFAACFCMRPLAQENSLKIPMKLRAPVSIDSLKRAMVTQKLIALSEDIGPDNSAVSRLLTNIAIAMLMRKEDHIDQVVDSFTNSAIDAQIQSILKEREEIEKLKKLLLNTNKK